MTAPNKHHQMKTSLPNKHLRPLAFLPLCLGVSFALTGCSAIVESLLEGASDRRAEKRYERGGATPREAKQMVFEDDFFKDVGGRP